MKSKFYHSTVSNQTQTPGILRAFLQFSLLLLLLLFCAPGSARAASRPVQITDCRLVSSSRILVTARLEDPRQVSGSRCYLFQLTLADSSLKNKTPILSIKKSKKMTFSVLLNKAKTTSRLYSRFILASRRSDGTYQIISNSKYISNPGRTAKYKYKFPTAVSKKGLQVSASMLEDAAELNVRHSVLNIVFSDLFAASRERNRAVSVPYNYHGKTYWFRRSAVESYDRQLRALKESDTVVSAILLLGWRDDLKHLIYPSGRVPGHAFYAWNTTSAAAREQLQAGISFLADRYSASSGANGRIVNWIVGNEVNNYKVYNYAGAKTLRQYAGIYARAFRLTYNTVTSIYSNARVYISLDHLWNTATVPGTFPARKMLDSFASALRGQGSIPWNLAYHPYSSPLTEPKFWLNENQQLTQSLTSPVINMGNISLLTTYIRQKYGSGTRIILSEQGYTSVQNHRNVEKEQSAAIVYSYYLAESDDMIDSFIMNRHVDHEVEVRQGLNLGLWTTSGGSSLEWAEKKKNSWKVFKYMDTNKSAKVAAPSLSIIGIEDWTDVIDGYSPSLYNKVNIQSADVKQVSSYKKKASVTNGWKGYGAVSRISKTSNGLRVYRNSSQNRNALWGYTQSFSKPLSFSSAPVFYTTLKLNGASNKRAAVKIRFFSGNHILESTKVISAGAPIRLGVSLKNWKYRKYVTKIQILAAPYGKGSWNGSSTFEMQNTVRGK